MVWVIPVENFRSTITMATTIASAIAIHAAPAIPSYLSSWDVETALETVLGYHWKLAESPLQVTAPPDGTHALAPANDSMPGGQAMHEALLVEPVFGFADTSEQRVQKGLDPVAYVPTGQVIHDCTPTEPDCPLYVPAGHGAHASEEARPGAKPYVPGGQAVMAPFSQKEPHGHSCCCVRRDELLVVPSAATEK
jgi:hypothetical protein